MSDQAFIEAFSSTVQPYIDTIKSTMTRQETKRFNLMFVLLFFVTGILISVQTFDLSSIFFFFALGVSILIYYVGSYALNYEYSDELERKIFSDILTLFGDKSSFISGQSFQEDVKQSSIFFLFDAIALTQFATAQWNAKCEYKDSTIKFSSIQILMTQIDLIYHSINDKGLFITINHLPLSDTEFYIYKHHYIPSLKQSMKALCNNFHTFEEGDYTIVAPSLSEITREEITAILASFKAEVTLSFKNNILFIFIHDYFPCFDPTTYTYGKVPTPDDFLELLHVKNRLINIVETLKQ